jgi:uracil-DNA glycosylase
LILNWSQKILDYHFNLSTDISLPRGVDWLYPYSESVTQECMTAFYTKYYSDQKLRKLILGINPGRFGAGLTGVPFTDPIRLEDICGIPNDFAKKQELSSVFVYDVINAYGSTERFYQDFYISSICPLGFIKDNKNYNYYDNSALLQAVEPFVIQHLRDQINFGVPVDRVFCLGQGKNFKYLEQLNARHDFFGKIIPLPHPRWVMQYRLRRKAEFLDTYLQALSL